MGLFVSVLRLAGNRDLDFILLKIQKVNSLRRSQLLLEDQVLFFGLEHIVYYQRPVREPLYGACKLINNCQRRLVPSRGVELPETNVVVAYSIAEFL